MFELNLSCSTFEKISGNEIIKPLAQLGVEPRAFQRLLHFLALHEFTLIEARKATCRLKSWADRQNFPWRHGLDQARAVVGNFCSGGLVFLFAPVSTTNFIKRANAHDTERHARF